MAVCNYTAPPLFKNDVANCNFKLMGHLVGGSLHAERSCGILLSPGFLNKTARAASLFATEYGVLTALSNCGCQCDNVFQLLFDIKSRTETLLLHLTTFFFVLIMCHMLVVGKKEHILQRCYNFRLWVPT